MTDRVDEAIDDINKIAFAGLIEGAEDEKAEQKENEMEDLVEPETCRPHRVMTPEPDSDPEEFRPGFAALIEETDAASEEQQVEFERSMAGEEETEESARIAMMEEQVNERDDREREEEQKAYDQTPEEKHEALEKSLKAHNQGFVIKNVGEKVTFSTGAVRDTDQGKPRPDLIHPHFERRVGQHLGDAAREKAKGGKGYGEWNWSKGIPLDRSFASLRRHMMEYAEGDTKEDHLAAAACNIMFIMCTEQMVKQGLLPKSMLTMPDWLTRLFDEEGKEINA